MSLHAWAYLLLAVLAVASWWIADGLSVQQPSSAPAVEHYADYFSTRITKTTMNEDGTRKQILVAQAMVHYKDDDTTELAQPVMTVFNTESPPWVIRSMQGFVSSDRNEIVLGGNVIITRKAGAGVSPVKVITSNLTVHRSSSIADTPDHAELISPPYRISGIGMRVHFQDPKTVSLLSKVRGKYEPN